MRSEMRRLILSLLLLSCGFVSVCTSQVIVTPVDAWTTPVYFCNGSRVNTINIAYAVVNLGSQAVRVDSITFRGTRGAFTDIVDAGGSYLAGPHGFMVNTGGPTYAPPSIGRDTCWATIHVGSDTTTSTFVCSAEPSLSSALLGYIAYDRTYGSFGFGGTVREEASDTLIDQMQQGPSYKVSSSPQAHGENEYVCFFTCAGAVIDSVVPRDTFTEFAFHDLPAGPVSVHPGDSLTIHYDFIPSIIGKHARPLVFYLHDGRTLVWTFKYNVTAPKSVAGTHENASGIFPNPARTQIHLPLSTNTSRNSYQIFDESGRSVAAGVIQGRTIPVEDLPDGTYTVLASGDGRQGRSFPLVIRH